jgi:hypothetical protein
LRDFEATRRVQSLQWSDCRREGLKGFARKAGTQRGAAPSHASNPRGSAVPSIRPEFGNAFGVPNNAKENPDG